ncbi:MAG: hypothetical protein GDA41_00195 [Rhodospirillales bacterium]|nr:hypothetical protein [Rhodospirillales bacterium]
MIDGFACFAYTARRATATVNSEAEKHGIPVEEFNIWLILRVIQTEGIQKINSLAWQLSISKQQMLNTVETMERGEGLIVYVDPETPSQFQRKVNITATGQTRLAILETRFQTLAENFGKAMPPARMISFARSITSAARRLKNTPQAAAPKA